MSRMHVLRHQRTSRPRPHPTGMGITKTTASLAQALQDLFQQEPTGSSRVSEEAGGVGLLESQQSGGKETRAQAGGGLTPDASQRQVRWTGWTNKTKRKQQIKHSLVETKRTQQINHSFSYVAVATPPPERGSVGQFVSPRTHFFLTAASISSQLTNFPTV